MGMKQGCDVTLVFQYICGWGSERIKTRIERGAKLKLDGKTWSLVINSSAHDSVLLAGSKKL